MMISAASLRRLNLLETNNNQLQKSLSRLASGIRVNRAADDAAGLAVADGMRTQIRGATQANANVQDGINYIQTADAGIAQIVDVLHRMRELSVQAANDTNTDADRAKIQEEIKVLRESLNTIPEQTEFNGLKPIVLTPARRSELATAPGNQLDVSLVLDGDPGAGMQISYLNIMATFQAVQADLQARNIDLRMGISLSGYSNGIPIPLGNSTMTDQADGVRLLVDATTSQPLMKEWLFYTIGPAQYDTNPNPPFVPIIDGPGRFNTTQDNYSALMQTSGVAGTDAVAGTSETVAGVVPTTNPLDGSPAVAPGYANTTATGSDAMTRRAGVEFFQILLTNHAPGAAPNGALATNEAAVAAALSADPNLHTIIGTSGGAGSPIAGAYDDIVTATNGFFFDMNANTPAAYTALADQIQGMIPPVPSSEPTTVVWDFDTQFHVGANEGQTMQVIHPHISAGSLGLESADLSTQPQAELLIGRVDNALKQVLTVRAHFGAAQNRLESAARSLDIAVENQSTSFSRIHDTDMAAETANLTKRQILQQASTSLMAQANQLESSVWSLIRSG